LFIKYIDFFAWPLWSVTFSPENDAFMCSMIVDVTEMLENYWAWFVSLHVAISLFEFAVDLKEAMQAKIIKKLPLLLQDSRSNVLVLQPCSSESAIKCIVGWTCDISWIFMFELWMYGFVEFFVHIDTRF